MTDLPDFEFTRRFRQLIIEQLALESVRGGSWKKALEDLKRELPKILELDQADIEREIAHLLKVRAQDADCHAKEKSGSYQDNQSINLVRERALRILRETNEQRKQQGKSPLPMQSGYGEGVRKQVFEVVVRQGVAGAPWRELCAGPMVVNNIDPEEVQDEIDRRLGLLGRGPKKKDDNEGPPKKLVRGGGQPKTPVAKKTFPFFGGASKKRSELGKSKGKDTTLRKISSHNMKSPEQSSQSGTEGEGKDQAKDQSDDEA